jgi:hypothetical protein
VTGVRHPASGDRMPASARPVVGARTAGKGNIQIVQDLPNGGHLRLNVASLLRASGMFRRQWDRAGRGTGPEAVASGVRRGLPGRCLGQDL